MCDMSGGVSGGGKPVILTESTRPRADAAAHEPGNMAQSLLGYADSATRARRHCDGTHKQVGVRRVNLVADTTALWTPS